MTENLPDLPPERVAELAENLQVALYAIRCHNGHLFKPGRTEDEGIDPRWCDECGETRHEGAAQALASLVAGWLAEAERQWHRYIVDAERAQDRAESAERRLAEQQAAVRDALLLSRCQIGAFKAAQSEIGDLDRAHIDVLAVGRVLSRLRDAVGEMFTSNARGALSHTTALLAPEERA